MKKTPFLSSIFILALPLAGHAQNTGGVFGPIVLWFTKEGIAES